MAKGGTAQPKQRRARERVSTLLDAADLLLQEVGVEGFAMAEVARRAGAAQGSLYRYFSSREALLAALHERQLQHLEGVIKKSRQQLEELPTPVEYSEFLEKFLGPLGDFLMRNPSYRLLRIGMPPNWQGSSLEAILDARVIGELAEALSLIAPQANHEQKRLVSTVLLEIVDTLFISEERSEVRSEGRSILNLYLRDFVAGVE